MKDNSITIYTIEIYYYFTALPYLLLYTQHDERYGEISHLSHTKALSTLSNTFHGHIIIPHIPLSVCMYQLGINFSPPIVPSIPSSIIPPLLSFLLLCIIKLTIASQRISIKFIPNTLNLNGKNRNKQNSNGINKKLVFHMVFTAGT
mmetsp:Transcript_4044/g.9094  ORF Transcript_4044/g.9094 Transcript_4044/m.9094 type:complete len:147 (-) Transcript_4044:1334-1774(-)